MSKKLECVECGKPEHDCICEFARRCACCGKELAEEEEYRIGRDFCPRCCLDRND